MKEHVLTNQQLLEALGLKGLPVIRLTIKAEAGGLPVVLVEMHSSSKAVDLLQKFELIAKAPVAVEDMTRAAITKAKGGQD